MNSKQMEVAKEVIESVQCAIGSGSVSSPIHLHSPDFSGTKAIEYVQDCLSSGWVSTSGKWVDIFEQEICKFTGARFCVAVSNGTVGLRLALHVLGVVDGDEVLIPPLTFVATANAIRHLGAFPHFVDIEADTLGLSPRSLSERLNEVAYRRDNSVFNSRTGRRIAAIVPVHIFGNPARIEEIKEVAEEWNIPVVEDAAEALGSYKHNTHCGLYGEIGVFSFNGNKIITTGGGGALITNSNELYHRAKHLSTTAKKYHQWELEHDAVGWNDRLPNINAALGVSQIEQLETILRKKKLIFERYQKNLSHIADISLTTPDIDCSSNNWLVSFRLNNPDKVIVASQRHMILEQALGRHIYLRPSWKLLSDLEMYCKCESSELPRARDISSRLICLPSSPSLSNNSILV